jgi:hypothetical protein
MSTLNRRACLHQGRAREGKPALKSSFPNMNLNQISFAET